MGNIFTKKNKKPNKKGTSKIDSVDQNIGQLKVTRDKLKTYQRKLENNIEKHKLAVKDCIHNKNKEKALVVLRKQKFLEKTLVNTRNESLNLEQLIVNIETTQQQTEAVNALKQGNELLKQLNQKLVLDDVEKLMEETHEAVEYQQHISDALSQQGFSIHESDLLEELDQLDEVEALEYDLPNVPQKRLPEAEHPMPNKNIVLS